MTRGWIGEMHPFVDPMCDRSVAPACDGWKGASVRRRTFLVLVQALVAARAVKSALASPSPLTSGQVDDIRRNWKSLLAPNAVVAVSTEPLKRSQTEWRALLNKDQFAI